jgi:hypothetical protein
MCRVACLRLDVTVPSADTSSSKKAKHLNHNNTTPVYFLIRLLIIMLLSPSMSSSSIPTFPTKEDSVNLDPTSIGLPHGWKLTDWSTLKG